MATIARSRRWIWITLSLVLAAILGVMAAGYTATIVSDYRRMLEIAREFERPKLPTITLTLGSIGFAASILGVMIFLFRLLREMQANQVQSEFIARVSHELKTPLATIELTADLLRTQENPDSTPESEERQKLWRSHDEELDRLKRQVHSLLETARWQVSPRACAGPGSILPAGLNPRDRAGRKSWVHNPGSNSKAARSTLKSMRMPTSLNSFLRTWSRTPASLLAPTAAVLRSRSAGAWMVRDPGPSRSKTRAGASPRSSPRDCSKSSTELPTAHLTQSRGRALDSTFPWRPLKP